MREVAIIGIGQTPVDEHWDKSLRELAGDAILAALRDSGRETADGLFVGNMMSGILSKQESLGALIADWVGLRGIEAVKVEAACGSGAAALRTGLLAVRSGEMDCVIVAGVEKMTENLASRNHSCPGHCRRCRLRICTRCLVRGVECSDHAPLSI